LHTPLPAGPLLPAGLPPDNKNNKRMQIEKHKYANIHRYILTRSFVDILCLHNE